jgi:hypothetical protein
VPALVNSLVDGRVKQLKIKARMIACIVLPLRKINWKLGAHEEILLSAGKRNYRFFASYIPPSQDKGSKHPLAKPVDFPTD